MTLTEFKEAVAQLPNSDNLAPIIKTIDGSLHGVREVGIDDGYVIVATGPVLVHYDGPPREPRRRA